MTHFLHKKKDSNVWYYRRRYPQEVAQLVGKPLFMQSLKTTEKRQAERLSRQVSVEFDAICRDAMLQRDVGHAAANLVPDAVGSRGGTDPDSVLAEIPRLVRAAAHRVVQEQIDNPKGWLEVATRWQSYYEAMKVGAVPGHAQRPAVQAQAILRGIQLVMQGEPIPREQSRPGASYEESALSVEAVESESWEAVCLRAVTAYREKVVESRYKLAKSKLPQVKVQSASEDHVREGLKAWCITRLKEVQPRTVKGQLDCMMAALRCVMPKLQAPALKELKGVMQPQTGDRQSMPVLAIRDVLIALRDKSLSPKVRKSYSGGASQFDAIAVEALAVLGLRPRELMQANPGSLVSKTDVLGQTGLYFRVTDAKTKSSEREIPLRDAHREVVNIVRLREMLEWQQDNPRTPHGAVSSFSTRFRKVSKRYVPYQMRHSWKDLAVHAGVDYELRERILGHAVKGVAAVYGSGIPLKQGLDALEAVRSSIYGAGVGT